MNYVFSTLATDMTYVNWHSPGEGIPPMEGKHINIRGGAGVARNVRAGSDIWTPLGDVTEISDEDLALMEQNEVFRLHQKNGFIRVQKKSSEVEKAVADMNRKDNSSPLTEADVKAKDEGITVSTGIPKSTLRPGI
jgi:rRNA maturation endonuclease Nob1